MTELEDLGICVEEGEARAFARGVLFGTLISAVMWAAIAAGIYVLVR